MSEIPDVHSIAAWFAGPKAENGEWFTRTIGRIIQDYHSWRRNYFPEDGVVVDSALRRRNEHFQDAFEDRLLELLARLKADFPFHSPRYAAHMISEQSLPAIAGYFAAMLYNPNNVSNEAAPVTVRLEYEASGMISRMLGHGKNAWAHLTSGGTVANIEALWIARSVKYLPFAVADMRRSVGLEVADRTARQLLDQSPTQALEGLAACFREAQEKLGKSTQTTGALIRAYLASPYCIPERGIASAVESLRSKPLVLVPESHHYCFEKALDVLGIGRRSLLSIPVDKDFRMIPAALEERLAALDKAGDHALAVVAVVGTTEEGAVDPVDKIVELRERREQSGKGSFWLHIDAAYGGYLRTMTIPNRLGLGEARSRVKIGGVERDIPLRLPEHGECAALECMGEADSITIDPHKLGYIPYPAGAVSFRSNLVKPIARQEAPYLAENALDLEAERTSESIGMYILEGSKPGAAAAAVWMGHTLIPLDQTGHGLLIRETVRNACELHALLETYGELTGEGRVRVVCLCPPGSNIVCYVFVGGAKRDLKSINELNRRVYERFMVSGGERVYEQRFFVSRTTLLPNHYGPKTVSDFLARLGVTAEEYEAQGIFLLRSVLMNPWYGQAKERGRYFLSELAEELFRVACEEVGG